MSGRIGPGVVLDGTYRIVRLIGQGGMGEVYEARHARLAGRYAVKVLHHEIRNHPEVMQRFAREARVTSALRHPGIVQVIDFNTTPEGAPYLVMELLAGEDLGQVIAREGRLTLERTVDITSQVASALAAAHRRGVVHRDLKPQNIFVVPGEADEGERAKVLDFGISKIRSISQKLTGASVVLGTPQFMAPEQAEGGEEVDATADQFALAAIVYEMLTGQPAFTGDTLAAVLYKIVHKDPVPIGKLRPDLPSRVGDVLARAFSKGRADRFSSISELARHLRAATEARGQGARRDSDATVVERLPAFGGGAEVVPSSEIPARSGRTLAYGADLGRSLPPKADDDTEEPVPTTAHDVPAADWRSTTFRRMTGEMFGLRGVFRSRAGRWILATTTLVLVVTIVAVSTKGGGSKGSRAGSVPPAGSSEAQRPVLAVLAAPTDHPALPHPAIVPIGAPPNPSRPDPSEGSAGANVASPQADTVAFELASDPAGLPVRIDGKAFPSVESQARTWARGALPPGVHKFELTKEGFEPWRKTVEIKADRPNRFMARLKKDDPADIFLRMKQTQPGAAASATKDAATKDGGRVPASTAAASRESCSMTIGALPWTELWLDGTNTRRNTPVASLMATCGPHRIGLKRTDLGIDFAADVILQPGKPLKRVFHFDAAGKVVP